MIHVMLCPDLEGVLRRYHGLGAFDEAQTDKSLICAIGTEIDRGSFGPGILTCILIFKARNQLLQNSLHA